MGVRRDIPEILQAIDVMVFPSLHEGLPFALVEAQAAGVPCVVSDTVSRDTQLTDIINYISLDEQPGQWAEKILEYKGYEKISKENQLAERGFSLETMICNIEKILNS